MKTMKWIGVVTAGLMAAALFGPARAAAPETVWVLDGMKTPESVYYDADRNILYVSNMAGAPTDANGTGYIAKVSLDGNIVDPAWVTGLNAPKGMAAFGGKLYVSDINRLVEIDIEAGKVVATYEAPKAKFLNDVTVDQNGAVYVSEFIDSAIYRLSEGRFEIWLEDAALASPNGLVAEEERLMIGAWGVMTDGFGTKVPGHLMQVDYFSKTLSSVGDGTPVGNLDGLAAVGDGSYLATDWIAGGVYHLQPSGAATLILDLNQGSADMTYIPSERLILIPMMNDNQIIAARLP
ncbi:MAG: SMP-30/gluconolactonase/LRE family protein [Magnetospiraceae bacterium]